MNCINRGNMKATDLMIGDWVNYNPNVLIEDEYEQAKPIDTVRIERGEDLDWADEGCYEPIPLTEEILKTNGFENMIFDNGNTSDIWKLNIDSSHFYINIDRAAKYWWISSIDAYIHFHYVHELQHALRLCGLSELADNFKIE